MLEVKAKYTSGEIAEAICYLVNIRDILHRSKVTLAEEEECVKMLDSIGNVLRAHKVSTEAAERIFDIVCERAAYPDKLAAVFSGEYANEEEYKRRRSENAD